MANLSTHFTFDGTAYFKFSELKNSIDLYYKGIIFLGNSSNNYLSFFRLGLDDNVHCMFCDNLDVTKNRYCPNHLKHLAKPLFFVHKQDLRINVHNIVKNKRLP